MTTTPATVERRGVDTLTPYDRNARTHSAEQIAQIAASIQEFGFTNPILIDPSGGIVAGHGRVAAARDLGMTEVPCIVLSGLTDAQRRAYVIADNRLALNAGWDFEMLAVELDALRDADFALDVLGFSREELNGLIGTPNFGPPLDGSAEGGGAGSLSDRFLAVPFSVLNAREGWWQDRKRAWLALGIKSELGRGEMANDRSASTSARMNDAADGVQRYNRSDGNKLGFSATATISRQGGTVGFDGSKLLGPKPANSPHEGDKTAAGLLALRAKQKSARANAVPSGSKEPLARLKAGEQSVMKGKRKPNATPGGAPLPAADYSKRERGDGRGRALKA